MCNDHWGNFRLKGGKAESFVEAYMAIIRWLAQEDSEACLLEGFGHGVFPKVLSSKINDGPAEA